MDNNIKLQLIEKLGLPKLATVQEVLDELSCKFAENVDAFSDPQEAFDVLNMEIGNHLLGSHFVYSVSKEGETWEVEIGNRFEKTAISIYIKAIEAYYSEPFSYPHTEAGIAAFLRRRVEKTMSNVGCGAKTALSRILEEDLDMEEVFCIVGADAQPTIQFLS